MKNTIQELAKLIRYWSLVSTTEAGSGHPTSSMSAADLMTVLFFGGLSSEASAKEGYFKFDLQNPGYENNDRLIFSKGHASPLFYALWAAAGQRVIGSSQNDISSTSPSIPPQAWGGREDGGAAAAQTRTYADQAANADSRGKITRAMDPEELFTLRKFGSRLEGHPTLEFPYTEVPTGSLGQGLSVGVGMAMSAKLDKLSYRTFVLLGDSEMAEGSVWEAMALASHYKLNNLVGIIDVNRLGQRGETMLGHDTETYKKRAEAFGWEAYVIDGHNLEEIGSVYQKISQSVDKPAMIIAKTLKGKGVSFLEDKDNWHGKALSKEDLEKALKELGEVDKSLFGIISFPEAVASPQPSPTAERVPKAGEVKATDYPPDKKIATRKAYGNLLPALSEAFPNLVVLDAETSNSTYAEAIKKTHPEKFSECFIAEQNMVGMALGFSKRGKIPFVSTFAAFLSRAFDQIRMSQFAGSNIKFIGSHAGVSIGEDGASQMALEDIAMFRTMHNCVVLYPSDAVSAEKLIVEATKHFGNVYIRTTRMETEVIYANDKIDINDKSDQKLMNHNFRIGGSCTIKSSDKDIATVIGAGVTLHEALKAYEILQKENINIRVIDLYSIKPIDTETLVKAAKETKNIIVVEDHYPEGGIGEAIASSILDSFSPSLGEKAGREVGDFKFTSLAVKKMPKSGKSEELLAYEEIDAEAIAKAVKNILK